ncbi:nucleotide exchange factor GrpE [Pelotomaculum isophthalicicum JI]|uniref:Protein GrpE n=1 Tax=Pelotomaculum isophthalicicum JI TaxID=947010 RepID=A0A9X4H6W3_9FIRM|nr:nucleotide exchange factor GrpE [Pelotomaculum isophthalicicum]MDF9409293.1 nucleotide exchange factor GrpE [Pelotomaculum isophthalicicum JI]
MSHEEGYKENLEVKIEQPEAEPVAEKQNGTDAGLVSEDTGTIEGKNAEEELTSLQSQLEEQKARADDYYNRLARVQADYENYRRRTRQEKEEFFKYASEQLIVALLPVLDNFGRALAAESQSIENFKPGVEMIYRQLQDVLQAEGLAPVPAVGEQFDPVKHEAVMQEESDEHPDNTVIEEFQRGYYLKEKVIRPAMVKVAKSS